MLAYTTRVTLRVVLGPVHWQQNIQFQSRKHRVYHINLGVFSIGIESFAFYEPDTVFACFRPRIFSCTFMAVEVAMGPTCFSDRYKFLFANRVKVKSPISIEKTSIFMRVKSRLKISCNWVFTFKDSDSVVRIYETARMDVAIMNVAASIGEHV